MILAWASPFNPLTAMLFNWNLIGIFTDLKLCLADAKHNFKSVKIIQIWQKLRRSTILNYCWLMSRSIINRLKADIYCAN